MKSSRFFLLLLFFFSAPIVDAQCLEGNCTNGWGYYRWDSGDKYTGQWSGGDRTGLGVYDWKDGSFYYGYFQDGKLEGDGFYIGLDSTQDQIGLFHNGTLSQSKSFETSGCLIGNCTNGSGIYLWETNDLYIGEWANGNRTGFGRYDWKDGGWYIGYFTNGKLNGEGEYHPAEGDAMVGKFVDGAFQGSTSSNSSASSSSANVASYPDRKITNADFCTVVKNVFSDYSNNFENIKGTLNPSDDYLSTSEWTATWNVSGSSEAAVITEPLISGHNIWYNVLFTAPTKEAAKAKYEGYVTSMKNCGASCCNLVFDNSEYKGDSYESYTTYWLTKSVKEGYSDDFNDMEIEIQLAKQILNDGWEVIIRVEEVQN